MLLRRLTDGLSRVVLGVMPLLGACASNSSPASSATDAAASRLPDGLRAAYIFGVQSAASENPAYRIDSATNTAHNPAQKLSLQLGQAGLVVSGERADTATALALIGYGCEHKVSSVNAAAPQLSANRVEYPRGDLTEWYVNGPLGVEQGFTVAQPPHCANNGSDGAGLRFELDWQGALEPVLTAAGREAQRLELRDLDGRMLLAYSDLAAFDAEGQRLPAHMTLSGRRLALHVDDRAARYPVTVDPLMWAQQAKLTSSDSASNDTFGNSVAIAGDTAIIGDAMHDVTLTNQGAAYVFVRSNAMWMQQARLIALTSGGAGDAATNDQFGAAVAISADTVIIGAPNATVSTMTTAGAAYVFTRSGQVWNIQQKLSAATPATAETFGRSVAVDGDIAVVGAPGSTVGASANAGAMYAFARTGTTWNTGTKLSAADALANDNFGTSVALSGSTAVAGSPRDDTSFGTDAGSAYVFFNNAGWTQQAQLFPSSGSTSDLFGTSVGISGDTAVVGAPSSDFITTNAGAAFVYTRPTGGSTWTQQQRLTATDAAFGDNLGVAVAIFGDTVAAGANLANGTYTDQGAVYVFTRLTGGSTWTQQTKLQNSDANGGETLGAAIALHNNTVLGGAPLRQESFVQRGATYVFFRGFSPGDSCTLPADCVNNMCVQNQCRGTKTLGTTCMMGFECSSGFCADGVCCDTACGGAAVDCQACSVAQGATISGTCTNLPATRTCRPKKSECDRVEMCRGNSPNCPADEFIGEGQPCAYGMCVSGECMSEVPLAYIPPGAQAMGCELGGLSQASRAPTFAIGFALTALALLRRRRRA